MAAPDDDGTHEAPPQDFERRGVVSVWLGMVDRRDDTHLDTLRDLCGVRYYRLDDQESNVFDFRLTGVAELLAELSYSTTYAEAVIAAAAARGIHAARSVVVQYDFAYDPRRVAARLDGDPVFIGVFDDSDA
ncbi:hypothetical protein [Burkholderia gladioli]|uniref:hypothetical protein n=1 Tax=Burkholderia gladioli TaxID=28095 RepID=UPI00163F4ECA|nr:hypothetical protein [Burkholderia gladioli]